MSTKCLKDIRQLDPSPNAIALRTGETGLILSTVAPVDDAGKLGSSSVVVKMID